MTNEDFDAALALAQDGDSFAIRVEPGAPIDSFGDDLGKLIEGLSGNDTHIGLLYNKAQDKTIEAQPPCVDFSTISKYRGLKGISIYFYKLPLQTDGETQQILSEAVKWIKVPYNVGILAGLAVRQGFCDFPVLGGLLFNWWIPKMPVWGGWDTAALHKSGVDCSCVTSIMMRAARPNFLSQYKDPRAITPTIYADNGPITEVSRAIAE